MTNNFDNTSFYLDQAGLELSLSDFAFDATQASQVQQHLQQQQQQQQLLHQQHQHQQRQQKQQHQQEQQKLQNLLLRDDPSQNPHSSENQSSNNNNQQHDTSNPVVTTSSGPYDFHPAAMTMEMMNPTGTGSASTTPVFQTHPDKINNTSNNTNNGTRSAASLQQLQQQHQQQQLLLQQQQQRQQQQLRQQQQHQLQQLPQTQAQLQAQAQAQTHAQQAHHQHKDGGAAVRQNLLKPTGSDYYTAAAADYSQYQYMSPMGIQPDNSVEAAMTMPEQFDEEAADSTEQLRPMSFIQGTPMLSPELTPANPYPNLPQSMSSGDGFTPLTSPAIGPHRNSQMDYISFTNGQGFSALPMQFQQAHQIQQQQLQNFQAQQQQQFLSSDIQQQQQQIHQGIGTKHARDVANGQRPGLKRRPTVEHSAANGVGSRTAASTPVTVAAAANATASIVGGGGPIRLMSKSSPALGPLTSTPLSQTGVRKPVVSASTSRTSRPSSLVPAPASPMGMHFSGGNHRITPSPIMTSTINGTPQPQSQPSPSPHLVGGMNQLSMMPASPAMFSLPASSMMPPPMTLPQQQTQNHIQTHRQLQISQPVHMQQQQQQYQLSIHPPQQLQQQQHNHFAPIGSMLRPTGSAAPLAAATIASAPMPIAATTTPSMGASADTVMGQSQDTASPSLTGTLTPKFALAPVTPASLMKLSGAGSGSESTPTSSPKSTFNNINTNAALAPANSNNIGNPSSSSPSATAPTTTATTKSTRSIAAKSTEKSKAPAGGSGSSSRSSSGGSKRSGGGSSKNKGSTNAGVLAPRTPGTTATTVISAMPAGGFATLISPALKPTLMPQPPLHHRGSLTGQQILVSTSRGQSLLVSPSLKPWLPGVSTTEAMARLASKSNYQNILDGDHTALGLSYNTDLHSGIELRRTSHKAAEQKRRDSLKHCFDDLRHMIPNIVDKAPSKVFLLKKSFDYICSLKAEMAQRDLTIARMQAQQEYFQQACRQWFESGAAAAGGGVPDMEGWKMSEEMLDQATRRELEVAHMAAKIAEQSAVAVEAARIGNQPGGGGNGGSKDGRKATIGVASTQANGPTTSSTSQQQRQNASSKDGSDDDEDDDSTPTASRRSSTIAANIMSSMAPSSTSSSASSTSTSTPTIHPLSGASPLDIQMTSTFTSTSISSSSIPAAQKQRTHSRSSRSGDEDEEDDDEDDDDDDDEEDYDGDQEMRSVL